MGFFVLFFELKKNFFWPHLKACVILVSGPGMEPGPPAVKVQSPNPGPPGNSQRSFVINKIVEYFWVSEIKVGVQKIKWALRGCNILLQGQIRL